MSKRYEEYLRRNQQVAKVAGARAAALNALDRLREQQRAPQWLLSSLQGIADRTEGLADELIRWRDQASKDGAP